MICPHCKKEIPDQELGAYLAAKGGKAKSARKLDAVRQNLARAREAYQAQRKSQKEGQ